MMLLLLLLWDLPFQLLLLSPVILWYMAPPRWHWAEAAVAVPLWGATGRLLWRRIARDSAQRRAEHKSQGGIRWRKGMSADQFCLACRLFLHNAGWRLVETPHVGSDEVSFIVQKDRARVLITCRRGKVAATAADIASIMAQRGQVGFTAACLVRERAAPRALVTLAATRNVALIRFADLAFLSEAVAFGTG